MKENPLIKLHSLGQSIWLDYISRDMLGKDGELERLVKEDALTGVTSNPAIFEKAISKGGIYDEAIRKYASEGRSVQEAYEIITIGDIQAAADILKAVYRDTKGGNGFVSLEVSPHLAYDTQGTISEARELWAKLDRPNVMIKVPATLEGLPAIKILISEGINVNVTLLFSANRYREVAEAFISGLEDRLEKGEDISGVASVASFFLSRIDLMLDPMLDKIASTSGQYAEIARDIKGRTAIDSAKIAYNIFRELYSQDRWKRLESRGARPQRLLWASTSTKNPEYSDIMYVEALIGPNTVNTLPPETLAAYRDHGSPAQLLEMDEELCESDMKMLSEMGIDLEAITQQLEKEGVQKFIAPYDKLLSTLEQRMKEFV